MMMVVARLIAVATGARRAGKSIQIGSHHLMALFFTTLTDNSTFS